MQPLLNIVLVHGAFADGSSWSKVISILQHRGYKLSAVQNPLTSLAADVDATLKVIERQPGDVLLVGHSWGGVVVTQAASHPKVRGIVYLSALVPDSGESASQLLTRLDAPMQAMTPDKNGLVWLDDAREYAKVMAADLPFSEVRQLTAVQQPIAGTSFEEKVPHAAWHDKPAWYLVTQGDHALPAPLQLQMAKFIGAHTKLIESSHMSLVSHPEAVADWIEQASILSRNQDK